MKRLVHFVLATSFSLFVLCFGAGAQERAASAYRDFLQLKLPEQTDVVAKKINDRYYSLVKKKVATVLFKFTDSDYMADIEKRKRTDQTAEQVMPQLERTRLFVTYHLGDDSSDFLLINPPKVPKVKKASLDELEAGWEQMFTAFWDTFKPHVTRLIDPRKDSIRQAQIVKGQLVVTLLHGKGPAQTLVFDNAGKLRSWSGLEAKTNEEYKNTPAYESYEGSYLLKSLRIDETDLHVTYDLQYQPLNGVMVLKEVNTTMVGTGKNADLPPKLTMYFQDPVVTFEK